MRPDIWNPDQWFMVGCDHEFGCRRKNQTFLENFSNRTGRMGFVNLALKGIILKIELNCKSFTDLTRESEPELGDETFYDNTERSSFRIDPAYS